MLVDICKCSWECQLLARSHHGVNISLEAIKWASNWKQLLWHLNSVVSRLGKQTLHKWETDLTAGSSCSDSSSCLPWVGLAIKPCINWNRSAVKWSLRMRWFLQISKCILYIVMMPDATTCPPPPESERCFIPTDVEVKVSTPLLTTDQSCKISGSFHTRLKPRPTFSEAPFENLPLSLCTNGRESTKRTCIDDIITNEYFQTRKYQFNVWLFINYHCHEESPIGCMTLFDLVPILPCQS